MEIFLKRLRIIQKCYYCSLKNGTLIILWTWICFVLLTILGVLIAWSINSSYLDDELKYKFYETGMHERSFFSPFTFIGVDTSSLHHFVYSKIILLSLLCYISLFQLYPHILALYGIRKKKPSYLEPYIYVKITEFLFGTASVITLVLSFFVVNANRLTLGNDTGSILLAVFVSGIFTLIHVVLNYYLTNVVYSYYLKMKEAKKNKYQTAPELTAILPAENSLLQNPPVSLPTNNQPSVNLPIKIYPFANNVVVPSAPKEDQPFILQKDYNRPIFL